MKNYVRDAYASYAMAVIALLSSSITGIAPGPMASVFIVVSVFARWASRHESHHHGRGARWHVSWRKNSDSIYLMSMILCGVSFIATAHRMSTATEATELAVLALLAVAVELTHHRLRSALPRNADRFNRGHVGTMHGHR